ncbi:S-adenosyl-L-methionine-dependent methyltransferase [Chloropicon primus]|uniref:S-adenosyl-L-methionine-dependent methyltransferase n=1 Tax=Chloropicon primus TaxID=1764295 RepID=A0A5B8MFM1_9CHLO|nr:S-adenosyl-L-methionine-dependent methyltransferase [Chloropicon primus]|eukprot:QDZ19177.1 S-adenosyl-L-methionine-dependent methyltransferase [Chloropicon primus]
MIATRAKGLRYNVLGRQHILSVLRGGRRHVGGGDAARAKAWKTEEAGGMEQNLPLPLCKVDEKRSSVRLGALVRAYNELRGAIAGELSSSPSFKRDDHAPNEENLCTELSWLFEDSVCLDPAELRRLLRSGGNECRSVEGEDEGRVIRSRLTLNEFQDVWHLRLRERLPIQYILGMASWYDLELRVGPGVLIPRPETEVLLDLALGALGEERGLGSHPWLDLGTGTGALAIGLARHSEGACGSRVRVEAIEASENAAAYASENIERYGLQDGVRLFRGSWFEPLEAEERHRKAFGGIVSNPPYITDEEMIGLQDEVRLHEPRSALFGGATRGMDGLLHIVEESPKYLVPGGFLGLETGGPIQATHLGSLMRGQAWDRVEVKPDLQGVPRFLVARTRK